MWLVENRKVRAEVGGVRRKTCVVLQLINASIVLQWNNASNVLQWINASNVLQSIYSCESCGADTLQNSCKTVGVTHSNI